VRPYSSLSGVGSFPYSAEMQWALIFWPLHPLVQHAMAMFHPVCLCAIDDGWYVHPDLRREGVRGYSCCYPITIEVWMLSLWNDRSHVGSERGSHFHVHCARSCPSHRAGTGAAVRAPVAPHLARGLHVSLGRGRSMPRGSGAPMLTLQGSGKAEIIPDRAQGSGALIMSWGSGEAETTARGAYLAQDLFARLGRDRGWLLTLSDRYAVSAFGELVLPGLLRWGFSRCARWCRISPSAGYPSILIPDSSPEPVEEWCTPSEA
jgi:hypothetical protein